LGYWHDPAATRASFRNGWFATGDYVRVDKRGDYYFIERKKDIIRKKGENISTRELELVLSELPGVKEVAVIPVPSPLGEDDIKAYLVLSPGSTLSPAAVRAHCRERLSSQKTPALVEFVATLPVTSTQKIAKPALKTRFVRLQTRRTTPKVYLIDGLRTPIAKVDGAYTSLRSDELLAATLSALSARIGISHADDFLVGCANQVGEGERNLARQALLLSSFAPSTPAATLNRLSASSLEAVRLGFASLASGLTHTVLVGGVESFSRTEASARLGYPHLHPILKNTLLSSGNLAAAMAKEEKITRKEQDEYAFMSNSRALAAAPSLASHLLPTASLQHDQIPRPSLTLARLSALPPLYGDSITAGNSSKLGDCAGALLLASPQAVRAHSWQPLAGLVGFSLVAGDPADYTRLPVQAIEELLNAHDLTLDHVGVWEIHEAYAAAALFVARALHLRPDRINKWGGAISLGHPFGATGIRLLLSASHQLVTTNSTYAVVAICIGGGQALACLLRRP